MSIYIYIYYYGSVDILSSDIYCLGSLASIIKRFASLSQRLSRKAWRRGAAAAACRIRCAPPSFATAKALRKVLQLA